MLLHYEGTPGLWHSILHVAIAAGLPYAAIGIIPALFGLAAAWLRIRHSPLPLPIRLLLPFTFFLCYQYSVIARSYCLLPVLLFASATRSIWSTTAILCLMAAVSLEVARYLRTRPISQRDLYPIGYACTGVEPYFPANLFANVNGGERIAFWDWSNLNHVNDDADCLNVLQPPYVLIGYKVTSRKVTGLPVLSRQDIITWRTSMEISSGRPASWNPSPMIFSGTLAKHSKY